LDKIAEAKKQWGGKRPGSGRPTTGRKPRQLMATDPEWIKIREYADKIRGKNKLK